MCTRSVSVLGAGDEAVITDTFDVEVVSAPLTLAFVSLTAADGTVAASPYTINALVQYTPRVKVTTAEDANALTGTVVEWIATGSGLILRSTATTVGKAALA